MTRIFAATRFVAPAFIVIAALVLTAAPMIRFR
jgi:hypothetical protein